MEINRKYQPSPFRTGWKGVTRNPAVAVALMLLTACGGKEQLPASKADISSVNEIKSLTQLDVDTPNYLDDMNGMTDLYHGTVHISRSPSLSVAGWAVDSSTKSPAKGVYIFLDGKVYPTQYGSSRPDVAAVLKEPNYVNSGFTVTIPGPLQEGPHKLTVVIINSKGTAYYTGSTVLFEIR